MDNITHKDVIIDLPRFGTEKAKADLILPNDINVDRKFGTLIAMHGGNSSWEVKRKKFLYFSQMLAKQGIAVLYPNIDPYYLDPNSGKHALADVIEWTKEQNIGNGKVGVSGWSLGYKICLSCAQSYMYAHLFDCLVNEYGMIDLRKCSESNPWHHLCEHSIKKMGNYPIFQQAGSNDGYKAHIRANGFDEAFDAYHPEPKYCETMIYDGVGHGMTMFLNDMGVKTRKHLFKFLKREDTLGS